MIRFVLNARSGVPPYLQIIQQVKEAILLGRLQVCDQLPTVRKVVSEIVINPNTVFKAYRQLEQEGIVELRHGQGTFVRQAPPPLSGAAFATLRLSLMRWLTSARDAGLDAEMVRALLESTLRESELLSERTA
jgi:GntR family transcriptional regulator